MAAIIRLISIWKPRTSPLPMAATRSSGWEFKMPIPTPNLYPPFNTVRLSHVEFGVTDLARSRAFYVDTLGLQVSDEDESTIYLRALEERGHHSIILKKSEKAEARDLGFKLYDED